MHIPTSAKNLKDITFPQIRLGLQGASGTGKTWSALSFPNCIVADFDNSLTAHAGKNIPIIPFSSEEWMNSYANGQFKAANRPDAFPNRKDALVYFLKNDALKMTEEQTLIIDSWSAVQLAFDKEESGIRHLSKKGNENDYTFWANKIEYSELLCSFFMSVKCHVIVTFHEDPVRDKITGQLVEKIGPLMQGGFPKQLKRYFTDFYRTLSTTDKQVEPGVKDKVESKFYVQVKSDNKFDVKTRRNFKGEPAFIDITDSNLFERVFTKYAPEPIESK